MNHELLAAQVQRGNQEAFSTLYELLFPKVYQFIMSKVGNETDTQDIVSESFYKAFDKIKQFDTSKWKLITRIYQIAYRTTLDYYKTQGNFAPYEWVEQSAYEQDFVQKFQDKQRYEEIIRFLDGIDPKQKEIFMMRVRDNLSYEEISQIINSSPNACKQIFYRTMKTVQERFAMILFFALFVCHTELGSISLIH